MVKCKACNGTGVDDKETAAELAENVQAVRIAAARENEDPEQWVRKRWLKESLSRPDIADKLYDVILYFQAAALPAKPGGGK